MTIRIGNLAGRAPLGMKQGKPADRPDYLEAVRAMPCIICEEYDLPQLSVTTAHHPIHDRGGQRKRPDITALPLCEGHHQGLWDQSKVAIHKQPRRWRELYGADHEYIARVQDRLAHLLEGRT